MEKFYVKPAAADLLVHDPVSGEKLPANGAFKPRSQYWLRRLAQGEIVETTPPPERAPAKAPAPASEPKSANPEG